MELESSSANTAKISVETVKTETPKKKEFKTIGQYAREIRSELPKDILKPNPLRLGYMFSYYIIIAACFYAMATFDIAWYFKIALGLVIGQSFGAAAFLAHEILHGSVVRNKKLQHTLGFLGFTPFLISPTFWCYWHNRLHHGHTQKLIKDPDTFPTLRVFKQSKYMQNMYKFTPGSGYLRSYLYFFFWFTFHNIVNQVYLRFRNRIFDNLNHSLSSLEFVLQTSIMAFYIYFSGENWVYTWFIPFLVMNYLLMSYISTNHNVRK